MRKILLAVMLIFTMCLSAYAEDQYNFSFPRGTNLSTALYSIAYRAGRDVAINVDDAVVLSNLTARTADEALDILAKAYDFNWMIDNNTIIITPSSRNTQFRRFVLKNADLKLVKEELLSFLPESKIRINPEYNTVSVDGTPAIISKVERTIAELDKPVEQIFIMAQMIEVNRNDSLSLGFQYTLPGYDNSTQPFRAQFTVTSSGERTFDKGNILARPAITTFNGQEATLHMGDQVPVIQSSVTTTGVTDSSVTFQDVGAKLKVTPYVNDRENKIITLNLEPSVSSVAKWITSGDVTAPQISTRTAKTKVRVKSGENIVIGGLMRQSDIESLKGIPGLMNLPILGKLFQYKEKTKENSEVFFIVTPYLLDDDTTAESLQNVMRKRNEDPKKAENKENTLKKVPEKETSEKVSVAPVTTIKNIEESKENTESSSNPGLVEIKTIPAV